MAVTPVHVEVVDKSAVQRWRVSHVSANLFVLCSFQYTYIHSCMSSNCENITLKNKLKCKCDPAEASYT